MQFMYNMSFHNTERPFDVYTWGSFTSFSFNYSKIVIQMP